MSRRGTVGVLLSLVLVSTGCEDPPDPGAAWSATIAYEAGVKLGGCDVGNLDRSKPGNEIVAVAADGRVFLVHHREGAWHGEEIARAPGEMIQCAIGDADPTREGNELVVVGMAEGTEDGGGKGAVHLVFREGDAWRIEHVFEDDALVHGVCIADVDPSHDGSEIVVVGFSRRATILARVHGAWSVLASVELPGAGKAVASLAGALLVANTSLTFVVIEPSVVRVPNPAGEGEVDEVRWPERPHEDGLWPIGTSQARIGTGEKDVVVACDDGSLRRLTPDGAFLIHQETSKLRGAVIADLDPFVREVEAATAGYGKTLTLLYRRDDWREPWQAVTLWHDTDRFHHVAAGELVREALGLEVVGVGYSGRVVVASRTSR
jgi:hypothetical protein